MDSSGWEFKFNESQNQLQSLQQQYKSATQQIDRLNAKIDKLAKSTTSNKRTYDLDTVRDIKEKIIGDPDAIKLMVRHTQIGINDKIERGRTLLIMVASSGCYELVCPIP